MVKFRLLTDKKVLTVAVFIFDKNIIALFAESIKSGANPLEFVFPILIDVNEMFIKRR